MNVSEDIVVDENAVQVVRILNTSDYFELLQVTQEEYSEMNKNYRRLSLVVHPDKNTHPKAQEAFQSFFIEVL